MRSLANNNWSMVHGHRRFVTLALCICLSMAGCRQHSKPAAVAPTAEKGRAVVVWISVDGLRPDYVDRAPAPFLKRLMSQGAFSREVTTVVPTLTFPSHLSQATGVTVDHHGIPANSFFDTRDGKYYDYPADAALLESEAIWHTAQRQGRRTLVYDWPMSQKQEGQVRSDYFLGSFERGPTSEQRLARIIETWRSDTNPKPLQLLMGYVSDVDTVGHRKGPDSPEVLEAMRKIDGLLEKFVEQVQSVFREKMASADRLSLFITTDHGMMPIHTLVNLEKLTDSPIPRGVRIVRSGAVAYIHFDRLEPARVPELKRAILRDLSRHPFIHVWTRDQLPKSFGLNHPYRVGDIVAILKPGYTFSERLPAPTFPVEKGPGPYGMHGFLPDECPEMRGLCILWRADGSLAGRDLGAVHVLQFHRRSRGSSASSRRAMRGPDRSPSAEVSSGRSRPIIGEHRVADGNPGRQDQPRDARQRRGGECVEIDLSVRRRNCDRVVARPVELVEVPHECCAHHEQQRQPDGYPQESSHDPPARGPNRDRCNRDIKSQRQRRHLHRQRTSHRHRDRQRYRNPMHAVKRQHASHHAPLEAQAAICRYPRGHVSCDPRKQRHQPVDQQGRQRQHHREDHRLIGPKATLKAPHPPDQLPVDHDQPADRHRQQRRRDEPMRLCEAHRRPRVFLSARQRAKESRGPESD
jgi:hypothetical protein